MVRICQYAMDRRTLLFELNSDRLEDTPELRELINEIEAELERREPPEAFESERGPDGPRTWMNAIRHPRNHDLAEKLRLACEAAEAKTAGLPPLEVEPGDWVVVGGQRLRVARTMPEDRKVQLQVVDPDTGATRAAQWTDGTGLEPAGREEGSPPEEPRRSGSGYDKARRELNSLNEALERRKWEQE